MLAAVAPGDPNPVPYLIVIVAGFVIGTLGHMHKSKTAISLGILLILAGTGTFQYRLSGGTCSIPGIVGCG